MALQSLVSDSLLLKLPNTFRAFYGGFIGLHRVQKQALTPILDGRDLVGSGKSEAVLAPCLERVEMRYPTLFDWIRQFKKQNLHQGYVLHDNKRKYFDGLKSSNIENRKIAVNNSIKWILKY